MPVDPINNGQFEGDQSADTLWSAFNQVNENFAALDARIDALWNLEQLALDAEAATAAANAAADAAQSLLSSPPTAVARGGVLQGDAVADATDEASAVTQLNALLAQLRASGVLAT